MERRAFSGLNKANITDLAAWCNIDFTDEYSNPLHNGGDLYLNGELVTSLTIPAEVKEIKPYVFSNCNSLMGIEICDGIIRIDERTFSNCTNLKSIIIPKSVINIGAFAFSGCVSLETIYYTGSEEEWNAIHIEVFSENIDEEVRKCNKVFNYVPITVTYNGERISFDQVPVIEECRTLVPLRAIFEKIGAEVGWDGATQTVTATKGETKILLQINSAELYVNGNAKVLDVPAKLINDRTMVPVRAISEAFGCTVDWVQETQNVVITE